MEDNNIKTGADATVGGTEGGTETITMTQAELDALLQKTGDQRVSQALKSVEKKHLEQMKESEKLARMNEQEKYVYELEQREKAIATKEKELALAENKAVAASILNDKGLSSKLIDFVVAEDAETMKSNIDILDKAIKASIKSEVEKRIATNSLNPKASIDTSNGVSKDQFKKMSIAERTALKNQDPELYNSLTQ